MATWLFALVGPSLVSYVSDNDQTFLAFNLNEEENQEQSPKKNTLEEKFVKNNFFDLFALEVCSRRNIKGFDSQDYLSLTPEVKSPPPEHFC